MPEKTIPHNIDAEQSVLGSMFLTKKALQKALELLDGSEFYLDNHAKIFECMKEINAIVAKAPIAIGDVVLENVAGTGVAIVATKAAAAK